MKNGKSSDDLYQEWVEFELMERQTESKQRRTYRGLIYAKHRYKDLLKRLDKHRVFRYRDTRNAKFLTSRGPDIKKGKNKNETGR